jgi:hypothetical protein
MEHEHSTFKGNRDGQRAADPEKSRKVGSREPAQVPQI